MRSRNRNRPIKICQVKIRTLCIISDSKILVGSTHRLNIVESECKSMNKTPRSWFYLTQKKKRQNKWKKIKMSGNIIIEIHKIKKVMCSKVISLRQCGLVILQKNIHYLIVNITQLVEILTFDQNVVCSNPILMY